MKTHSLVDDALARTLRTLLEDRPINKITVEEIAEKSGLSKRTFYNHFHDKHDLVAYIWRREYESCWFDNGRFLSCEEFLIKYHRHEETLVTFFLNTLAYMGQNNLWETIHETSADYVKMQMRHNGFSGEFDSETENAIYFWIYGIAGISRRIFEYRRIRHINQAYASPEELTRRELALIPEKLRPWLTPNT